MSNSIEVLSATHGIAPRSDELLRLGGDLERGRISAETYGERLDQETADWLQLQADAGIDLAENGKLRWSDHLRPIVKATAGFAEGIDDAPVTRWFDTNRFYRRPVIKERLRFDREKFEAEVGKPGEVISLLSPQTFASLCGNDFPEFPADRHVFQLYSDLFWYLEHDTDAKLVILEDYLRGVNILSRDASLSQAQQLAQWSEGLDVALISPLGGNAAIPYSPSPANLQLNVENGTLHHLHRHIPAFRWPPLGKRALWQLAIPADTTSPESISALAWPVDALRALKPACLILTNTVDLEHLPLPYAQDKVKALGELTFNLRELLEAEL